jgi:hypothetical protein
MLKDSFMTRGKADSSGLKLLGMTKTLMRLAMTKVKDLFGTTEVSAEKPRVL